MKNLKVRVWLAEENRFRYCDYIPTMGFVWSITSDINEPRRAATIEVGEEYSQQFTTIIDCNGQDIYEGDIAVVRCHEDWDDVDGYDVIYTVCWCDIQCGWRGFRGKMIPGKHSGVGLPKPIRVIGNIFETTGI